MAREFTASSSEYLEVSSSPVSAWPITFGCFWRPANITTQSEFFFIGASAGTADWIVLGSRSDGSDFRVRYRYALSNAHSYVWGGIIAADTWYHTVARISANDNHDIFTDGSKVDGALDKVVPTLNSIALGRLSDPTPSNYSDGAVAEAFIYNVALTDDEIAALSAGYSPLFIRPQSLQAYWPLIRDEDQDRLGGYDLTAFNTPTILEHPPVIYPARVYAGFTAVGAAGPTYTLAMGQGSYTLSGQTVDLLIARKLILAQGSYTYTGQAVGLFRGFTIAIAQGSYTLTGQAVALMVARTLAMGQGSYTLSGQAVGLLVARLLAIGQGSYTLTGQDVALLRGYTLTMGQGSYALTGQAVGLLASRLLAIGQGSYTLTGQDVTLTYTPIGGPTYTLTLAQGSYALTGQSVGLKAARLLTMGQGAYTLTGQSVGLLRGYTLAMGQGSYVLSGQDIDLLIARVLALNYGAYALTGQAVTLTYSGELGYIFDGDVAIRITADGVVAVRMTADGDVAMRFTADGDVEL